MFNFVCLRLRGFYTPSITPDLLELETFLRIAKLDYNVKITDSVSSIRLLTNFILKTLMLMVKIVVAVS